MKFHIGVIPGDGIGPEITKEAIKVMDCTAELYGFKCEYEEIIAGGSSIDKYGQPLTDEAIEKARQCHSVLLGAIGGDAKTSPWYKLPVNQRPEEALLQLRKELNLFANLRPIYLFEELAAASPLKDSILGKGIDLMIVRELTGGLYFGDKDTYTKDGIITAVDTMNYDENEIARVSIVAFELARKRKSKLLCVDKANLLESSRLWRTVVDNVAREYKDVEYDYMYVDHAAMNLIMNPHQYGVILTENTFGDILSDEAAVLAGSIGMIPSASLSDKLLEIGQGQIGQYGLYEPIAGAAPDISGKNIANPLAAIMCCEMMLRYSLVQTEAADAIFRAVEKTIKDGYRTEDILTEGCITVSTSEMGDRVVERLER